MTAAPDGMREPGDIEQGWISFLHQLRHLLARHPDASRRTIFRSGTAVPTALAELP